MIRTYKLLKKFGLNNAVAGLDLEVCEGQIFGFIGPNGAGKTTTIRILSTLLRQDGGEAWICGMSVASEADRVRQVIGFMPDTFGVYGEMLVLEYLEFFAAAYGMRGQKRRQAINDILALTDLEGKRMELAGSLSRGMQQRLGLARVLVHDPKVLLLDEPASGLDPRARVEVRELLKELGRMGKTILVSSHILADLADICDTVGIIEKGRLLYSGPVRNLVEREGYANFNAGFADQQERDRALILLSNMDGVEAVPGKDDTRVAICVRLNKCQGFEISRKLVQEGLSLCSFEPRKVDLEEAFIRITKGEVS